MARYAVKRALMPVLAVVAAFAVCSRADATVTCGQKIPKTKNVALASLSLEPSSSLVDPHFKWHTTPRPISLYFKVEGCTLPKKVAKPTADIAPVSDPGLPDKAVTIERAVPKGSVLVLHLLVHPKTFDPGSYKALFFANADYLATNSTPISTSRSDSRLALPIVIAVVGGIAGVAWLAIGVLIALSGPAKIDFLWLGLAVLVGGILGVVSLKTTFQAKDVWTWQDDGFTTLLAAFAAGSAGAVTGLVGKGVHKRIRHRRTSRHHQATVPSS